MKSMKSEDVVYGSTSETRCQRKGGPVIEKRWERPVQARHASCEKKTHHGTKCV